MSDSDDSSILEDPQLRPAAAGGQKWSSGKFVEVVSLVDSSDDESQTVILVEPNPPSPAHAPACTLEIVSLADGDEADSTCAGPAASVDAPSAPLRVCDVIDSQSIRDELHHNGSPALIPQAQSDTEEAQSDTEDDSIPWEDPLKLNEVSSSDESDSDFFLRQQNQQAKKKRRKEEEKRKKGGKRSKFDNLD